MPGVPLRKGITFQAFLLEDKIVRAILTKPLIFVLYMNLGLVIFIICQGTLSLFKAQWEQREVRNWIFRTLMGRNLRSIHLALNRSLVISLQSPPLYYSIWWTSSLQ